MAVGQGIVAQCQSCPLELALLRQLCSQHLHAIVACEIYGAREGVVLDSFAARVLQEQSRLIPGRTSLVAGVFSPQQEDQVAILHQLMLGISAQDFADLRRYSCVRKPRLRCPHAATAAPTLWKFIGSPLCYVLNRNNN